MRLGQWTWKLTFLPRVMRLLSKHKYTEAESLCRVGITTWPRAPIYHLFLGKILWKVGKLEDALQEYRVTMALRKAVLSTDRFDLIRILLTLKRYEEAIVESQKLLDPHFHRTSYLFKSLHIFVAYGYLYEAYIALEDYDKARSALIKLLPFYKGEARAEALRNISLCDVKLRDGKTGTGYERDT